MEGEVGEAACAPGARPPTVLGDALVPGTGAVPAESPDVSDLGVTVAQAPVVAPRDEQGEGREGVTRKEV